MANRSGLRRICRRWPRYRARAPSNCAEKKMQKEEKGKIDLQFAAEQLMEMKVEPRKEKKNKGSCTMSYNKGKVLLHTTELFLDE